MKYIWMAILLSLLGCGTTETERIVEVEVPIPQEPPPGNPPPLEPARPDFVNFDQAEQFALNDLNSLNQADRLNTRYLIGCNFYNSGQKQLDDKLSGINKGINSISVQRLFTYATPIDPAKCLWRVDISEFGATRSLWREFEKYNLISFISLSTRGTTLRFLTQTNQPMVYSSSFFTTVMGADQLSVNNGLYYKFLRQPLTNDDFFNDLGIDLQDEVNDQEVSCAGGGNSRIALGKTRLICILDTADNGYILSTYDTSLINPDSVLANPFTPEIAQAGNVLRSNKLFGFAAQEHIYSLPNGLLTGYRLNNNAGNAETIAPTNIVIDIEQSAIGLPPDITLGACSNCHHQTAAIQFSDQVFNQVQQTGGFYAQEKELAQVFFRNDSFQAKLSSANSQHTQALAEIGVSTLTNDPVVTGHIQPLRRELNIETVASYTFLPVEEFRTRLIGTNQSKIIFGALLNVGGTVQFSDFANNFQLLTDELLLFRDNELN